MAFFDPKDGSDFYEADLDIKNVLRIIQKNEHILRKREAQN